jgi:hypothetical protein
MDSKEYIVDLQGFCIITPGGRGKGCGFGTLKKTPPLARVSRVSTDMFTQELWPLQTKQELGIMDFLWSRRPEVRKARSKIQGNTETQKQRQNQTQPDGKALDFGATGCGYT